MLPVGEWARGALTKVWVCAGRTLIGCRRLLSDAWPPEWQRSSLLLPDCDAASFLRFVARQCRDVFVRSWDWGLVGRAVTSCNFLGHCDLHFSQQMVAVFTRSVTICDFRQFLETYTPSIQLSARLLGNIDWCSHRHEVAVVGSAIPHFFSPPTCDCLRLSDFDHCCCARVLDTVLSPVMKTVSDHFVLLLFCFYM